MKNLKYLFGLMFIFALFSFYQGDFHTSSTKVEFESESSKLSISSRFLTSDLEKAVGGSTSNKNDFDNKLKNYINSRIVVKVNGNTANSSYGGFQTTDKATRIFMYVENVNNLTSLEVKNSMLFDAFPDQQNLVAFDVNGVRKSFNCKKGADTGKISF